MCYLASICYMQYCSAGKCVVAFTVCILVDLVVALLCLPYLQIKGEDSLVFIVFVRNKGRSGRRYGGGGESF